MSLSGISEHELLWCTSLSQFSAFSSSGDFWRWPPPPFRRVGDDARALAARAAWRACARHPLAFSSSGSSSKYCGSEQSREPEGPGPGPVRVPGLRPELVLCTCTLRRQSGDSSVSAARLGSDGSGRDSMRRAYRFSRCCSSSCCCAVLVRPCRRCCLPDGPAGHVSFVGSVHVSGTVSSCRSTSCGARRYSVVPWRCLVSYCCCCLKT